MLLWLLCLWLLVAAQGQKACEVACGTETDPDPNKASSVTCCQLALKIAASVAIRAKQAIISFSRALPGDTSDV